MLLRTYRNSIKKEPVIGKIVCSCNNVGKGNIEKAIAEGYTTLPKICEKTSAGTACGSCKPELMEILKNPSNKSMSLPKPINMNGTVEKKKGFFATLFNNK